MARVKHTKAEKAKIRRRRARQFRGAVFLLLAFVGVISIISVAVGQIRKLTNDDAQKAEFAKIIAPLVALDPAPFEGTEKAKAELLEEASIRAVISNENISKYVRTSEGQILIPVLDVDRYFTKLFGSGSLPRHATFTDGDITFEYDSESKCYIVTFTNLSGTYYPRISKIDSSGSTRTLTVDYLSYADQGNVIGVTGDEGGQRVIKTMEYILLKESGEYHIYSVRDAGQSS